MARLAFRETSVIERHLFPIGGVVTVGALPGVMIFWSVILQVTGLTIGETGVIKGNVRPVSDIHMAVYARAEM